ncbi:hypothetical protein KIPB_004492, partial [Kipferlia bialata]
RKRDLEINANAPQPEAEEEGDVPMVEDDRFAALFGNADFQVDTKDAEYKNIHTSRN